MSKSTHDQFNDAEERIAILENALEAIRNDIERHANGEDSRDTNDLLRDLDESAADALGRSAAVVA